MAQYFLLWLEMHFLISCLLLAIRNFDDYAAESVLQSGILLFAYKTFPHLK